MKIQKDNIITINEILAIVQNRSNRWRKPQLYGLDLGRLAQKCKQTTNSETKLKVKNLKKNL